MARIARQVIATVVVIVSAAASSVSAQSGGASVAARMDSVVRAALSKGPVAGISVAVVRGRDTVLLKAYGLADAELGVPTPDDAVYEIGSASKQFTAAAIMQLAEEGRLSLDDDVGKYVPRYASYGHAISLRRLLDHTSGIFDYVSINGYLRLARVPITHDSLVALFGSRPLDFAPGTAMAYSNSGYILLGLVIERVSGQPYDVYVKQHLFERAGMSSASYCDASRLTAHRVHGYDVGETGLRLPYYIDFSWIYAAGSLCMTSRDLLKWTNALHGGRILGRAAYRELVTPDTLADGVRLRYADGLAVDSILGHRAVHHGGDLPGFTSEVAYLPDDSLTVVVLINTQGPVRADELTVDLLRLLVPDVGAARAFRGRAVDYVVDYVGEYVGATQYQGHSRAQTFRLAVDSSGRALTLQVDSGAVRSLRYLGGDSFGRGDARLTFLRTRGRVTGLHYDDVYSARVAVRTP